MIPAISEIQAEAEMTSVFGFIEPPAVVETEVNMVRHLHPEPESGP